MNQSKMASPQPTPTNCDTSESISAFKRKLIHHKRRGNEPNRMDDLEEVIDASLLLSSTPKKASGNHAEHDRLYPVELSPIDACSVENIYEGPLFGVRGFPGCFLAPQAIDETLQMELAYRAVSLWCEHPHRTNIDLKPAKSNERINTGEGSMWKLWKSQSQGKQKKRPSAKKRKAQHYDNRGIYRSFAKLSWATMGYHYNWTERSYRQDEKSEMPTVLEHLSMRFARTCLLLEESGEELNDEKRRSVAFNPTASIVNYYNIKSVMGGHQDDLELALDKPIVSISLGLPAVFLLGGKSKDEEPVVAILLRPGDVLCMGGASRLNFHAMARILPLPVASKIALPALVPHSRSVTFQSCHREGATSTCMVPKEEQEHLREYLGEYRININVRQVYPDGSNDRDNEK